MVGFGYDNNCWVWRYNALYNTRKNRCKFPYDFRNRFIATITATVSAYFLSNFGEKQTTLDDVLTKLEKIEDEIEKIKEDKNE